MPRRDESGSKGRRASARKVASGAEQRPPPSPPRGKAGAGRGKGTSKRQESEAQKQAGRGRRSPRAEPPRPKPGQARQDLPQAGTSRKAAAGPGSAAGARRPARPGAKKKTAGKAAPSVPLQATAPARTRRAAASPDPRSRPGRRKAAGLPERGPGPATADPESAAKSGAATLSPTLTVTLALTDEERIGSAKYTPRELPPRLFEEERFLFPESYGGDRVRLLVRDPEWLFAYWDLDPRSQAALRDELGERAGALSRLSLRVFDPQRGGVEVILLPDGARAWYVRTDPSRRTYRAELGFTLPSGEFRRLALSNLVSTPSGRPSRQRATRRASYKQLHGRAAVAGAPLAPAPELESGPSGPVRLVDARPGPEGARGARGGASDVFGPAQPGGQGGEDRPGASDARGGASDAFRPGASDGFEQRGPDRR